MKTLYRNLMFVFRRFRISTLLNVIGLSVALAVFMVIMLQVYYDRTYNSCIPGNERIFVVSWPDEEEHVNYVYVSPKWSETIGGLSPHVESYAYIEAGSVASDKLFYINEQPVKGRYLCVSESIVDVLELEMIAGDARCLRNPNTVLVPESFAMNCFGTLDVIGKTVDRDRKMAIGGIYKDMPENNSFKNCVYAGIDRTVYGEQWENWHMNGFALLVKLDSGDAAAGLKEQANNFLKNAKKEGTRFFWNVFELTPLSQIHYMENIAGCHWFDAPVKQQTEDILVFISLLIILIAGINYVNFSNALIPMRVKSVNTQKILGATRLRLCITLVVESVVVCLFSVLLAFGLVYTFSVSSYSWLVEADLSFADSLPVVIGMVVVAILVGVIASVVPALRLTSYTPAVVLKGSFGVSKTGQAVRKTMVGIQFFVSSALIVASLLMHKQQQYLIRTADYGFEKDELVACNLGQVSELPEDLTVVVNDMRALPFVSDASLSWSPMGVDGNTQGWVFQSPEGENVEPATMFASADYLKTMGIKLLAGRDFKEGDKNVVLVNKLASEAYKETLSIGREIFFGKNKFTVIGVFDDVKFESLRQYSKPLMIVNMPYSMRVLNIRIKKGTNMFDAVDNIQKVLKKYDENYPFEVRFYEEVMEKAYQKERKMTGLITSFSLLAVLISIIGVFGLVMFDCEYRKREIAVRKVFGSTTSDIVRMFNVKYVKILLVSFVLSVPVSYWIVSRWLENFAYKTEMSWWVFALAFVLLLVVTVGTVTYQCWRAAHTSPVENLKYE